MFLELFLSAFVGVPVLALIWIVASAADPGVVDNILTAGLIGVGQMLFFSWTLGSLIYTLQFTPLMKISEGVVLLLICLFASLWLAVALQGLFGGVIGIPAKLAAVLHALIGLIVFPIGWAITAVLYERRDL